MMEGFNVSSENGVIAPEPKSDSGPATLSITVSHGLEQHQVAVPSDSTFGDVKLVIAEKMGLKPETLKLLFRGKEKEDDDHLLTAGVKENSKVLLVEDTTSVQRSPETVEDTTSVQRSPETVDDTTSVQRSPETVDDTTSVQRSPETVEDTASVQRSPETVEDTASVQGSPEKVETIEISRGGEAVAVVREEIDKLADQVAALQAVVDGGTKIDDKNFLFLTEMLMRQLLKLDSIEAEGEGRVQRRMEVRRVQSFVETMDTLKSRNADINDNIDTAPVTTQSESVEPEFANEKNMSSEPHSPSTTPSYNPTPTPASAPSPTPTPAPVTSSMDMDTPVPFSIPGSAPVLSSPSPPLPPASMVTQDWEHFD